MAMAKKNCLLYINQKIFGSHIRNNSLSITFNSSQTECKFTAKSSNLTV